MSFVWKTNYFPHAINNQVKCLYRQKNHVKESRCFHFSLLDINGVGLKKLHVYQRWICISISSVTSFNIFWWSNNVITYSISWWNILHVYKFVSNFNESNQAKSLYFTRCRLLLLRIFGFCLLFWSVCAYSMLWCYTTVIGKGRGWRLKHI